MIDAIAVLDRSLLYQQLERLHRGTVFGFGGKLSTQRFSIKWRNIVFMMEIRDDQRSVASVDPQGFE
ncbi:Hypothetical protein AT6N2_L2262 [Agrobacterium tumefaciens]|nr:Hypothetical protein AT6N2_L2262 [Agrobacterium tumefaciens]